MATAAPAVDVDVPVWDLVVVDFPAALCVAVVLIFLLVVVVGFAAGALVEDFTAAVLCTDATDRRDTLATLARLATDWVLWKIASAIVG